MRLHPFSPERQLGLVYRIDGTLADIALQSGAKLPRSHFGEYLGLGEVGEFVLIDVGGLAIFGRIVRVTASTNNIDVLSQTDRRIATEAHVHLLSTIHLDGRAERGILKYPKVGDPVYAATGEAVTTVLGSAPREDEDDILLGKLSVGDAIDVRVPVSRLFGRHVAIVGVTGSGKSWTLAHIVESIGRMHGKVVLIDATGEFHTLADQARHLVFGSTDGETLGTLVSIPHYLMRETDRNAFMTPSSGTQLPKLREAVRSLRLAAAIASDLKASPNNSALIDGMGNIKKAGVSIVTIEKAFETYADSVEGPHAPFDLKRLGRQIKLECVWPTAKMDSSKFGDSNLSEVGYVSTLISRIADLVQTPDIMSVISPDNGAVDVVSEVENWLGNPTEHILRISLRNLPFANHLREIVVNILGQQFISWARDGRFRDIPLVVALDEAHQFFDVTVGDEFSITRLNAFDSIAKEGRKYGLTICVATQRPGELPAGVISQVGMTIVHRLADGRDRQRIEQAAAELDYSATRLLPGLVPGEAVLMGVDFAVPVSVRVMRPVSPPESEGPRYVSWRQIGPSKQISLQKTQEFAKGH